MIGAEEIEELRKICVEEDVEITFQGDVIRITHYTDDGFCIRCNSSYKPITEGKVTFRSLFEHLKSLYFAQTQTKSAAERAAEKWGNKGSEEEE